MTIKISKRAKNTQFSPIRKFVPLLGKVKKKGTKVFELHIGQPDIQTPKKILKKITDFKGKVLSYTPSTGMPEIKSAWVQYYKEFGISLDKSEIVVTTGGSEAIFFSFSVVCNPGEEIIVFEPFYTNYNSFASMAGIKLKAVRTLAEKGFHLPDRKVIEKAIGKRTRGILVCNPNNPTGTVYKKSEMKMIIDIARKHNLFVLSDEVYREFVYDGDKHCSVMDFKEAHERAILLDSVSKRFSACGCRIGCLVSRNKKIIEGVTKFAQARLSSPMLEQLAVIPLLKESKKYTDRIVKDYERRRDAVFESLKEIPGVLCLKPKGAFYAIVKLPVKDSEDFTRWLLAEFSWKGKTLMVAPASGFYATKGLGKDEIRIAFVISPSKLREAMEILKRALAVR